MASHCPDEVLRRVHYLVRQWISYLDSEKLFNVLESFKGEYDELSWVTKNILEISIDEIIDSIDPLFEKMMTDADRYNYLLPEIKLLFETDINSLLYVNQFLKGAIQSSQLVKKLESEIIQDKIFKKNCSNCSLVKMIHSHKKMEERSHSL